MTKRYRLGLFLVFLGLMVPRILQSQQLPQFSQYIFNGLHINPGYAGYKNEGYLQTTYRSQWVNFPGAPRTISITGDFSANEGTTGIGFSYVRDQIGHMESNLGLLTYAYRINTGENGRLALGISAGISEYAFDPSGIVTGRPDDPIIPATRIAAMAPTMNAGLFYHNENFYAGVSAYNLIGKRALLREDISVAYHDFHYYFTMGGIIPLTDVVKMKPSVLFRHVSGSPTSYDLNTMFLFKERLWFGGSYRSNVRVFEDQLQDGLSKRNAVALVMEYFILPGLRLGYAYDYNLNALNSYRNESHELSLGVYLRGKREVVYNSRWF